MKISRSEAVDKSPGIFFDAEFDLMVPGPPGRLNKLKNRFFEKKISNFLKKVRNYSAAYRAKFYYMIGFFGNFPHTLGTLGVVENCKTIQKLHPVVCVSGRIIFSLKLGF